MKREYIYVCRDDFWGIVERLYPGEAKGVYYMNDIYGEVYKNTKGHWEKVTNG